MVVDDVISVVLVVEDVVMTVVEGGGVVLGF